MNRRLPGVLWVTLKEVTRSKLLQVTLSFLLGGVLTFLTWFVEQPYLCADILACAWGYQFPGRGFPLPWTIEYPAETPPNRVILLAGMGVSASVLDLVAWSGLLLAGLLVLMDMRGERKRLTIDSKFVRTAMGSVCAAAGFLLALLAPRLMVEMVIQSQYGPYTVLKFVSSYPLLWYAVILLGEASAIWSHQRSRVAPWLTAATIGVLVTIVTFFHPQAIIPTSMHSDAVEYGFPLGWLVVQHIYMPDNFRSGILGILVRSFFLDAVVWTVIFAFLLILSSRLRARHMARSVHPGVNV